MIVRVVSCAFTLMAAVAVAAEPTSDGTKSSTYKHSDRLRPRPTVVTPPTASTQDSPGAAPSDAIVLFDGKDLSKWQPWHPTKTFDPAEPLKWIIKDGTIEAAGYPLETREAFADCHFHLEWRNSPEEAAMPERFDQHRGNGGLEFGDHPEIQILDSYKNDTYPDGQCASIYGSWPPLVNATREPGQWQTYDIYYVAPKFHDGKRVALATYTVLHNGLPVHLATPISGNDVECHIRLRPHGGQIRYRNLWIRPLHHYDENEGQPLPADARTTKPMF